MCARRLPTLTLCAARQRAAQRVWVDVVVKRFLNNVVVGLRTHPCVTNGPAPGVLPDAVALARCARTCMYCTMHAAADAAATIAVAQCGCGAIWRPVCHPCPRLGSGCSRHAPPAAAVQAAARSAPPRLLCRACSVRWPRLPRHACFSTRVGCPALTRAWQNGRQARRSGHALSGTRPRLRATALGSATHPTPRPAPCGLRSSRRRRLPR